LTALYVIDIYMYVYSAHADHSSAHCDVMQHERNSGKIAWESP